MKLSGLSAAWRIGPNAALTLAALLGTGIEAYIFNRLHETRIPGLFQVLLFSSLLWFWLTIVWLAWLAVRAVHKWAPRWRTTAHIGVGTIIYLAALCYVFCWVIFFQINAFPDAHWFQFIRSGYEVLWQEVQRSSTRALVTFYTFAAVSVLCMPIIYRFIINQTWQPENRHQVKIGFTAWVVTGLIAITSFVAVLTDTDQALRQNKITRFSNSVNPAITVAASLLAPYRYEAVKPDLDISKLEPRLTHDQLYNDTLSTAHMSVLYIAVESLRGDLLFREHQGKQIMPNLNALAKRSAVFNRAYAQSTHTDYSVPSYLSSQYPLRSQGHFYYELDHTWPKAQLYDHLHHYGYRTAIISSDTTNWGELRNYLWNENLDVFFDAENLPTTYSAASKVRGYVTDFKDTPRTESKAVPDRETVDFNITWIQKSVADQKPWFLYTFFYQPHYPYKIDKDDARPFQPSEQDFESTFVWFPPDKINVMLNAYLNAVHETDAQIGRLIQYLEDTGQMDNTIIVFTGDHGEAFAEHGVVTHAGPLFEEVVRVPLVVYAPGIKANAYEFPAQHIDAAPTVCGLLGIPAHPGFQGLDLLNTSQTVLASRDIYLHAEPPSSWRGDAIIQAGRWKFWHDRYSDTHYLYDLHNDPDESVDVITQYPDIARGLQEKLQKWRAKQLSYYTFKRYYEQYYPPDH